MKTLNKNVELEDHLQIQVPAETKYDLRLKALNSRESIRMVVLKALQAYGVIVPIEAICDRRKKH
ncbi:hypothetical protein D3Y57_01740 (plasmid) [Sphingomonas paeninsulae]|uniref:Uncharacterized protein n=2 Tax=Sphingomonas paeninsulae TaxID=2319844 RepID=A0A494T611_SPHPE|nr:hypothetical protein D3Y57_01740 [Sphingomonas paeninsulae]